MATKMERMGSKNTRYIESEKKKLFKKGEDRGMPGTPFGNPMRSVKPRASKSNATKAKWHNV